MLLVLIDLAFLRGAIELDTETGKDRTCILKPLRGENKHIITTVSLFFVIL